MDHRQPNNTATAKRKRRKRGESMLLLEQGVSSPSLLRRKRGLFRRNKSAPMSPKFVGSVVRVPNNDTDTVHSELTLHSDEEAAMWLAAEQPRTPTTANSSPTSRHNKSIMKGCWMGQASPPDAEHTDDCSSLLHHPYQPERLQPRFTPSLLDFSLSTLSSNKSVSRYSEDAALLFAETTSLPDADSDLMRGTVKPAETQAWTRRQTVVDRSRSVLMLALYLCWSLHHPKSVGDAASMLAKATGVLFLCFLAQVPFDNDVARVARNSRLSKIVKSRKTLLLLLYIVCWDHTMYHLGRTTRQVLQQRAALSNILLVKEDSAGLLPQDEQPLEWGPVWDFLWGKGEPDEEQVAPKEGSLDNHTHDPASQALPPSSSTQRERIPNNNKRDTTIHQDTTTRGNEKLQESREQEKEPIPTRRATTSKQDLKITTIQEEEEDTNDEEPTKETTTTRLEYASKKREPLRRDWIQPAHLPDAPYHATRPQFLRRTLVYSHPRVVRLQSLERRGPLFRIRRVLRKLRLFWMRASHRLTRLSEQFQQPYWPC